MKNKLFLLLTTSLLLVGCNINKKKSSDISSEILSSQNSSQIVSSDVTTSSETPTSSYVSSEESSNSSEDTTSSESQSTSESGYGYGYYNNYYGKLTWTDGADLKQKLHDIIRTGWNKLRYDKPNWESNSYADRSKYDFEYLDVLYRFDNVKASLTQKGWQREHAFPASLMTDQLTSDAVKTLGRATDFHNLFAGDASGNSSRGNKNFGVADKTDPSYTDRTTTGGIDGYSFDPKTFEPGNKDKGRVARAIFYMGTMYKDDEDGYKGLKIIEENVDYSSGNCQYAIGHLSELLTWSDTYKVDWLEMQHNESVYSHVYSADSKAQGNRNPFVDYPELVDYVYGNKQDQGGDLKDLKPTSYVLNTESDEFSHYALESAKREFSYGETLTESDYSIVKVKKNYTYESAAGTEGIVHSLLNHTFTIDDGSKINATVTCGMDVLSYEILLDPLAACSNTYINIKKTGIDKTKPNVDQNVTYGSEPFTINFAASGNITLTDTTSGGFKMGSGTVAVTKVTLTTVNSYTIDEAYINCYAANKDSSYALTIKVGATTVYSGTVTNTSLGVTYGGSFEAVTGQVSYIFTGSNAINLCNIGFNVVN